MRGRSKVETARLALGRAKSRDRTPPAAPSLPSILPLKIPSAPRPRQPYLRLRPLFGRHSVTALEKVLPRAVRRSLRMSGRDLVDRLNKAQLPLLTINAALVESGTDREFFLYAKAIAQHSAALGELLYGKPMSGLRPPGFVTEAAREALFHQGTAPGIDEESPLVEGSLVLKDIGEDSPALKKTDAAGMGLAFLHHSAVHATERWAHLMRDGKPFQGKPHVRALIESLSVIYSEAFDDPPKRQPSASAPVVIFCCVVVGAMFRRMARQYGKSALVGEKSALVGELRVLAGHGGAAKVAEYLRGRRRRAEP